MSSYARNIKVGIFVLAGLVFSALVIFLIGDERRLFSSSVEFRAEFPDVQGLKSGAPVQMGGLDIGHVSSVGYDKSKIEDATIYVTIAIVKAEAGRIKTDSKVRITTKGLLGDKMLEITKGKEPAVRKPGDLIPVDTTPGLMDRVSGLGDKADEALNQVNRVTAGLADEKLQRDLHESVASINVVLKQVAEGDGYPHKFITDKNEAEKISRTFENLEKVSNELVLTLAEVRSVVARVKSGPGFTHDVIYGDGPQKEIAQFGGAANEVALTLRGVREGDSLVHDALYGGKGAGTEAIANLTAVTADLKAITAGLRAGKGTVGALLVDPSVYEDVKVVLGNVQRNDVLRALVRYSIKQDEKKPSVDVGKSP
jgi:phospholipid/cholesterol/gamma-HCH transport system substrate-binding protein